MNLEKRFDEVKIEGNGKDVKDFVACRFKVTQDDYEKVMGHNPSHFKGGKRPVENVSWLDCIKYANKCSELDGFDPVYEIKSDEDITIHMDRNGYSIPTYAEFMYMAKGGKDGKDMKYPNSDDPKEVAWYKDNSPTEANPDGETHPVGMLKPNELFLFDMIGNVWDWLNDEE